MSSTEWDMTCLNSTCGHSLYDHTGWRESDPSDKRESCRVIGCGCERHVRYSYNSPAYDSYGE